MHNTSSGIGAAGGCRVAVRVGGVLLLVLVLVLVLVLI